MIHFIGQLPFECGVACSGGVDSMAVLHFLSHLNKKKVYCLYFNHGTQHSIDTEVHVEKYCKDNNIPFFKGEYTGEQPTSNKEEFWRDKRYEFFKSFEFPVITCHHLDDVVETWIFSSCHGNPKTIPYANGNVIRPFLITEKSDFVDWCQNKKVPFWNDPSNQSTDFKRNKIRHDIVPLMKEINPGLNKVVKKKIIEDYNDLKK